MHKTDINRTAFFENIGAYITLINLFLSKTNKLEPLGNHIKMVGGFAFKSKDYKNHGVPVIRISDFQDEKIQLTKVRYYQENEKLEKYELHEGDIIIAMTGGTIGKLAIVQPNLGKLYLNQRVGKFQIINKEEFDKEYIYWIARGIQDKLQNIGYGGAQPNISNSQLEKLEFPFPDKETQKTIVSFLNDLKNDSIKPGVYFDSETEKEIHKIQSVKIKSLELDYNIEEQLTFLTKLRQSILQDAVQGKLTQEWRLQNPNITPAGELLKTIKAEKEQLIKEKKIKKEKPLPAITKEEIPFVIPESWSFCWLGNLSSVRIGSTPSRTSLEYWHGKIPWVSSGEVANNFIHETKEHITEKALKKTSVQLYPVGTVLVAMIGQGKTRGQTSILKIEATTNQNVGGLIIFHEYLVSELLWYFFLSRYEETRSKASGGNQPAINGTKLKNTIFALPPLEEQKAIVEKTNQLLAYCDNLEQEIKISKANAEKLMQSVLSELLGEEN